MNKKALVAGIVFATVIMLFSMTPVLAAPKEELDFALNIQGGLPSTEWLHANGYIVVSPDKRWSYPGAPLPPPDGYAIRHYIDVPFNPTNVWVVINGETIPYSRLVYTAKVSGNVNYLNDMQANWKIDETVTIYTDSLKTTVWGTLEMRAVSHDYLMPSLGVVVGTFEGHGTGALEGVKVQGDCSAIRILGVTTRVRGGIAMGWP